MKSDLEFAANGEVLSFYFIKSLTYYWGRNKWHDIIIFLHGADMATPGHRTEGSHDAIIDLRFLSEIAYIHADNAIKNRAAA